MLRILTEKIRQKGENPIKVNQAYTNGNFRKYIFLESSCGFSSLALEAMTQDEKIEEELSSLLWELKTIASSIP